MRDIDKLVKPSDRKDLRKANKKLTKGGKIRFLDAMERTLSLSNAAKSAGISSSAVHKAMRKDPVFAEAVEAARAVPLDRVEDALLERAVHGVSRFKSINGEKIEEKVYSDTAALAILNAHRPEIYKRPNQVELTGRDGGPVEVSEVKSKLMSMMGEKVINGESEEVE